MNSSASATVLFIFQLPAISGTRSLTSMPPLRAARCPRSARASRRHQSTDELTPGLASRNRAKRFTGRRRPAPASAGRRTGGSATARLRRRERRRSPLPPGGFQKTVPRRSLPSPERMWSWRTGARCPAPPSIRHVVSPSKPSASGDFGEPLPRSPGPRHRSRPAAPEPPVERGRAGRAGRLPPRTAQSTETHPRSCSGTRKTSRRRSESCPRTAKAIDHALPRRSPWRRRAPRTRSGRLHPRACPWPGSPRGLAAVAARSSTSCATPSVRQRAGRARRGGSERVVHIYVLRAEAEPRPRAGCCSWSPPAHTGRSRAAADRRHPTRRPPRVRRR